MVDTVTHERIAALIPWSANARTHSKKQIRQIAASIESFGFVNPVLIDEGRRILAGHGRVAAAQLLGRTEVPCLVFSHMSEAHKRAYVVADNKLAENAGWDRDLLALELGALAELDLDFDLGVIGFDAGEIGLILDEVVPPVAGDGVTRSGDLWQLGPHRIVCGDARDRAVLDRLMAGERARMVFTDPPYNVRIDGHVCGSGKIRHREFAMAAGEMSRDEFTGFLADVFAELVHASIDGAIHFVCMDWRHMGEILAAGDQAYTELKNLIVWAKDAGGMGTFYRSRHELIFVFKSGTAPHLNTFGLGEGGRYRTNVWQYRGIAASGTAGRADLALHPTVKPAAMIADAIRDVTRRGDLVLDAFGGSGSTLIAAERTGRRARLVEIDPLYVDVTIRRWQAVAHDDAVLLETGESFAERQASRRAALALEPETASVAGVCSALLEDAS